MKRLFTFLILLSLSGFVLGQGSPRMVLWEHFTNTSCGPCASFNPQAEAYWDAHEDDVVAIAYHVWWPGANDPFYIDNTSEQQWRTNYYGCNSVPWTTIDGNKFNNNPNMTSIQNAINNQLNVPSPFSIDLSHVKSADNDSVYVTMDITCTNDLTANMSAFIVVVETVVDMANPPGNNGETHFTRIFKKFLPSQTGTALPGSMTNGQNVVVEASWLLANFFDHTNLAVVAFIQNTSTKEVYQAAYSAPAGPAYVEPEILEVTRPISQICGDNFMPEVIVRNLGGVNLTSLDFEYNVDGGDTYTYTWEGDLEYTDEAEVLLPTINFTPGASNTFNVEIMNPNGAPDPYPGNNTASVEFTPSTETSMNIEMQLFVGAWASDISWEFYNYGGEVLASGSGYDNNEVINMELPIDNSGCYGFTLFDSQGDGFAGGGYLKLYDNGTVFAYITNQLDDIIDIPFNALNPLAAPQEFDAAANGYDINFTWTAPSKAVLQGYNIYEAGDMATPINASLITGTSYIFTVAGNGNYEFYLQAVYDEGNSDLVGPVFADINVGIGEINEKGFSVYPNPVTSNSSVNFTLKQKSEVAVTVYNMVGARVLEIPAKEFSAGKQTINLSSSELMDGVYFVNLTINGQSITKKISVLK